MMSEIRINEILSLHENHFSMRCDIIFDTLKEVEDKVLLLGSNFPIG